MARARSLKPSFFKNEMLVELPFETRLLFAGLWCLADREGRLEDRPKKIKMEIFPADDVDVTAGLDALASSGFITRYVGEAGSFIQVINFKKHQNPHPREVASIIEPPPGTVDGSNLTKARTGPTEDKAGSDSRTTTAKPRCGRTKGSATPDPEGFAEFWAQYPRKDSPSEARTAWKKLDPDAALRARILADVEAKTAGPKWQENGGEFIPHASTYLNQKRWEDAGVRLPRQPGTDGSEAGRPVPLPADATREEFDALREQLRRRGPDPEGGGE